MDYSTIQPDLHRSRLLDNHHHVKIDIGSDENPLLQDLNQLGQDLSVANLSSGAQTAAQQAYGSLQQVLGMAAPTDVPNIVHAHLAVPNTVGLHSPLPPTYEKPVSVVA